MSAMSNVTEKLSHIAEGLQEKSDESGLKAVQEKLGSVGSLGQCGEILDRSTEEVTELASKASHFQSALKSALDDPSLLLSPGKGGMAWLARCLSRRLAKSYERGVVKRLTPLQRESDKIIEEISALPGKFTEVVRQLAEVSQARAAISKDFKDLVEIPIIVKDLVGKITAGADVLDLERDEEALQRAVDVRGSIDSCLETLKGLICVVKAATSDIQHSMAIITKFVKNTPADVDEAFDAPIACCLPKSLVLGNTVPGTDLKHKVEIMEGFDLQPLIDFLEREMAQIDQLNFESVAALVRDFSSAAKPYIDEMHGLLRIARQAREVEDKMGAAEDVIKDGMKATEGLLENGIEVGSGDGPKLGDLPSGLAQSKELVKQWPLQVRW